MNMSWNEVGVQFPMWYRVQVKALSLRSAKIDSIPSLGDKFEIRSGRKLFFFSMSMFLNVSLSYCKCSESSFSGPEALVRNPCLEEIHVVTSI